MEMEGRDERLIIWSNSFYQNVIGMTRGWICGGEIGNAMIVQTISLLTCYLSLNERWVSMSGLDL